MTPTEPSGSGPNESFRPALRDRANGPELGKSWNHSLSDPRKEQPSIKFVDGTYRGRTEMIPIEIRSTAFNGKSIFRVNNCKLDPSVEDENVPHIV